MPSLMAKKLYSVFQVLRTFTNLMASRSPAHIPICQCFVPWVRKEASDLSPESSSRRQPGPSPLRSSSSIRLHEATMLLTPADLSKAKQQTHHQRREPLKHQKSPLQANTLSHLPEGKGREGRGGCRDNHLFPRLFSCQFYYILNPGHLC